MAKIGFLSVRMNQVITPTIAKYIQGRSKQACCGKHHVYSPSSVGAGAGGGTPIFGNVASFMEHLQVHRREEMRPGIEMMGRLRGLAGRVPEKGEEFDVALLPL